ncbi:MAG: class I SAM-dependent methyltransferase [Betaproteobacteria bacterium]|nr:class I SAM-dependent methyltransferase [Betaproteobacteria bacterium]
MHGTGEPSDWVQRFSHLVAPGARVLDVACGAGRHSRWFAERGASVTALDRDAQALQGLQGLARVVCADIEHGTWPLGGETFDAIIVTNYLWRPLWPIWLSSLNPLGLLLVETFAWGHGRWGRPRNPDFLLHPGELLELVRNGPDPGGHGVALTHPRAADQAPLPAPASGLHVLAYEDGLLGSTNRLATAACPVVDPAPGLRRVQRIAALKPVGVDLEAVGDWPLNSG